MIMSVINWMISLSPVKNSLLIVLSSGPSTSSNQARSLLTKSNKGLNRSGMLRIDLELLRRRVIWKKN